MYDDDWIMDDDTLHDLLEDAKEALVIAGGDEMPAGLSDVQELALKCEKLIVALKSMAEVHATLGETPARVLARHPKLMRKAARLAAETFDLALLWAELAKMDIAEDACLLADAEARRG